MRGDERQGGKGRAQKVIKGFKDFKEIRGIKERPKDRKTKDRQQAATYSAFGAFLIATIRLSAAVSRE